ncbi:MAG: hypothetical protein ACP5JP_01815 [bacterium]
MKIKEVLKKYRAEIYLAILAIYAIILVLGAISEVFDLGWFRWLGPW